MSDPKPRTVAVRTQIPRSPQAEHSVPLYLTSSFTFDSAEEMRATFADELDHNIYSRFTNPNVAELTDKLRAMEGAEAGHAVASGMAAVFATFGALLSAGDHILACRSVFGSTHTVLTKWLPRWGITHTYVDAGDQEAWEREITDETRMIFVETPTNPALDILDLGWLGELAARHDILFVVDNCFATPVLQRPLDWGADLCVHSATKFIDGQGRVLGGAVVGRQDLVDEIFAFCRSTGPALSPFNAWVLSKSLETLAVRMERHSENALALAEALDGAPGVTEVRYPYLPSHPQHDLARRQMSAGGGILTFTVEGGLEQGRRFLDAVRMCSLTANLGDTRTIATHPASTTHAKLTEEERRAVGITPGLIRISVGLEDIDDIVADVRQALEASRSALR
ncbi:MAG: O-succinylhomoserine sulfhydrylase [Gemmatimonadota bacterium]|nr:O-succinylhomoserine sulfhydrylase [Gemmatimonadota bacterium]